MTTDNQNAKTETANSELNISTGSPTPVIDELRNHVEHLKALLDDPHPGLSSWCESYNARMQSISDFWNK